MPAPAAPCIPRSTSHRSLIVTFDTPQGKGITIATEESKLITRREEDLNGVNPFYAILGAGGAAAMSFGSWKVIRYLRALNTRGMLRMFWASD